MALTDVAVRNAKPREKAYKLGDGGGLFLYVTQAGGKLWRLKYRVSGKEKLLYQVSLIRTHGPSDACQGT